MGEPGTVYLVGAGPGDPGLLTLRGRAVLQIAQVIVYDGLVSAEILAFAQPGALRIYAGKKRSPSGAPLTQAQINAVLIEHAIAGRCVVRLKGGDPFLFGRGGEECEALYAAAVPFEIVPGVSAVTAVPAYAGIPLTLRGVASSVAIATGHGSEEGGAVQIDWTSVAGADTVVLFMSLVNARERAQALIDGGKSPETPVAAISWGTTPRQKVVTGTLATIADEIAAQGARPPALLVVGEVVRCADKFNWFAARPLLGARVLATRSAGEMAEFSEKLAEHGATCLAAPVTRRLRRRLGKDARALCADLAQTDWLCFTSANAVDAWFTGLEELALDARALGRTQMACVGATTAEALRRQGVRSDFTASGGTGAELAHELLASGQVPAGTRIGFPRATAGRDELATILSAGGAQVEVIPVYDTVSVSTADDGAAGDGFAAELAHALHALRAGQVDVLCAFAPSQVDALVDALGANARKLVNSVPTIAAIGPTTKAALLAAGLRADIVAESPSMSSLVRAVVTAHKEK